MLNILNIDSVIAATQAKGLTQTDPSSNDPFFAKYAYMDMPKTGITYTIKLQKLVVN